MGPVINCLINLFGVNSVHNFIETESRTGFIRDHCNAHLHFHL